MSGPQTSRVSQGMSPRLAILLAAGVLAAAVAVGVSGRQPPLPTSQPTAQPSQAVAVVRATPAPPAEAVGTSESGLPQPRVPPLFVHWQQPQELYQVTVRTGRQIVRTFVLPGDYPTLEGALSLRGIHHRSVDITLSEVNFSAPTSRQRIGRWTLSLPRRSQGQAPGAVLTTSADPHLKSADAPYLVRSGYTFVVSGRRLPGFTTLYLFVAVTYPQES